jgi:hypothetical protein
VGDDYAKKYKYRPTAERYRSATKWDDGNQTAWFKLGEAEEKLKDGRRLPGLLEIPRDSRAMSEIAPPARHRSAGLLNGYINRWTWNPCRSELNCGGTFCCVGRHLKIDLVAIHCAGIADPAEDLR